MQLALEKLPHKLPLLLREADRINERLRSDSKLRAPLGRSPKNCVVREAEEIESIFLQHQDGELDAEMSERAELMSDILYELSSETQIAVTHPQLVRAFYTAVRDSVSKMEPRQQRENLWVALKQIHALMDGCSAARFEEIDTCWHGEHDEMFAARAREVGEVYAPRGSSPAAGADELADARRRLSSLEDAPENEGVAFRLETEIFNLEHAVAEDEWPDAIEGGQ